MPKTRPNTQLKTGFSTKIKYHVKSLIFSFIDY